MARYLKHAAQAVATPPQSEPLNERQVRNSAGGYAYPVGKWVRLDRFLILGSEGGSYYASERKLTLENAKGIEQCIKEDGIRVVERIVQISDTGRAPKNDPALLALAMCAGLGNGTTRAAALDALPKVARISTHLFHFVDYVLQCRGWGRGLRTAILNWYVEKPVDKLADQVTKYQQRDGWSHRDLMRLVHGKFTGQHQKIARYVVKGEPNQFDEYPDRIYGHCQLQAANDAKSAASLIRQYGLVRESVPTGLLKEKEVWAALLEKMPLMAMIRNLGNMSKVGLLTPMSEAEKHVVTTIANPELLRKARVHPIQVLMAAKGYESGMAASQYANFRGDREQNTWSPCPRVVDALDEAYYATFKNVEPTGKRFYLGLDISGSMWSGCVAGVNGLTPAVASGAMAMVTVKTEEKYYTAGFTSVMEKITLSPRQRLDDVLKVTNEMQRRMGSTDCAKPMLDAMAKKIPVDAFVIYTDSETWIGGVHPTQALEDYRQRMGIPAKLAVVGMVSNGFSIADPQDGGQLDVVGFDTSTPEILASFARGDV